MNNKQRIALIALFGLAAFAVVAGSSSPEPDPEPLERITPEEVRRRADSAGNDPRPAAPPKQAVPAAGGASLTEDDVRRIVAEATAPSPESVAAMDDSIRRTERHVARMEDLWPQTELEPVSRPQDKIVWRKTWQDAWRFRGGRRVLVIVTDLETCAPCRRLHRTLEDPRVRRELATYFSCARGVSRDAVGMGAAGKRGRMPLLFFLPLELTGESVEAARSFDVSDPDALLKLLRENR